MKQMVDYRLTQADLKAFSENQAEATRQIIHKLDYPEAVTMSWMNMLKMTFFTTPAAHRDLLVNQAEKFHRDPRSGRLFRFIMGESVFTAEGKEWKRRRRLVQPAFHAIRINTYAETMATYTAEMVAEWEHETTVDIERAMTDLTMRIIASTMFGVDLKSTVEELGQLMHTVLKVGEQRVKELIPLPDWFPSPAYRKQRAALNELKRILADIIAERRKTGADHGDLLSMLLLSEDENGDLLSEDEALSEAITLFVAGHETTAVTLMWTFTLLAQHPRVAEKLHAELDTVLAGRVPTLEDLPNLPYTEMVMKETLRLYPAAYNFGRVSTQDVTVDGFALPAKRMVMMSPYILQRHPALFTEPDTFHPERFATETGDDIEKYAFIPFGAGPRVCLGNMFAMLEIRLLLATIASRVMLSLPSDTDVKMIPQVTLHPMIEGQTGIPMTVARRREKIAL
ncbi:MAG: cytochrome P450 [Chloroflexota bacterium]